MAMNTDTGNTLTFNSILRGNAATLIIDASTARVEVQGEPSSAARFLPIADPSTWVTLTRESDERLGAVCLAKAGDAIVAIPLSAAAALAKRFGMRVFDEGKLVDWSDVTWGAIRRGQARRRRAA